MKQVPLEKKIILKFFRAWGTLIFATGSASALTIPLDVREYHGVPRNGEPVSTGVPLPKGVYFDPTSFSVSGRDTQVAPIVLWPDGSIRWLLVQFQSGPGTYQLTDGGGGRTGGGLISEAVDAVTVNTGPLQFRIRKTGGFNLFDEVVLNGTTMVRPSEENGALITATHNNMLFKSAGEDHDDPMTPYAAYVPSTKVYRVTVLEAGPVRACIKVEGNHGNHDGAVGSMHDFYGYTAYIYAYAGKSYVKVQYVLQNTPFWTPRGPLRFKNLDLRTQVQLNASKMVTIFSGAQQSAALGANAFIAQTAVDAYSSTLGNGTKALGWMDVSDGSRGVAVGIKHFWENFPKALRVGSDGTLDVSLFPAEGLGTGEDYYIQDMAAKEHTVMFYFHDAAQRAQDPVASVMGGALNHPLFPTAAQRWYSETRAVLGEFTDHGASIAAPSLPLINDHFGGSDYYEGWYRWGESRYENDNGQVELYHDESLDFLRTLGPREFLGLEAGVKMMSLRPFQLHRDFRSFSFFRDRGNAVPGGNPGPGSNVGYAAYFGQRGGAVTNPNHWGSGTVGGVEGWHSFPGGWIVPSDEHLDAKHVVDYFCLTGDPFAKDIVRSIGEYRGAQALMRANSFQPQTGETSFSRSQAAAAYNLAAYYFLFPSESLLTQVRRWADYTARAPSADGYFDQDMDHLSPFMEGINAHVAGLFYEISGLPEFRQALVDNAAGWRKIIRPNGYIPYDGGDIGLDGDPALMSASLYRCMDGVMSVYQYTEGNEDLRGLIVSAETARRFGPANPWLQKYYFALAHPDDFKKVPAAAAMPARPRRMRIRP